MTGIRVESSEEIVRRLYPEFARECDSGSAYGPSSYDPIISDLGHVKIEASEKDYQGDTWVLFSPDDDDRGRYGYMSFGWGSCSGRDALQGCDTIADLASLYERLRNGVQWFDSPEAAKTFFADHDWQGDYGWSKEEFRAFVNQCRAHFGLSPLDYKEDW